MKNGYETKPEDERKCTAVNFKNWIRKLMISTKFLAPLIVFRLRNRYGLERQKLLNVCNGDSPRSCVWRKGLSTPGCCLSKMAPSIQLHGVLWFWIPWHIHVESNICYSDLEWRSWSLEWTHALNRNRPPEIDNEVTYLGFLRGS